MYTPFIVDMNNAVVVLNIPTAIGAHHLECLLRVVGPILYVNVIKMDENSSAGMLRISLMACTRKVKTLKTTTMEYCLALSNNRFN